MLEGGGGVKETSNPASQCITHVEVLAPVMATALMAQRAAHRLSCKGRALLHLVAQLCKGLTQ